MENESAETLPTLLLVDDNAEHILRLWSLLRDRCRIRLATSGERGLAQAARSPRPDLILLEARLPGMDGHETCRRLQADPNLADIPVIFLAGGCAADEDQEDELRALAGGALAYLGKPLDAAILRATLATHWALRQHDRVPETELKRRPAAVQRLQRMTLLALTALAQTREHESGHHLRRVQHYVALLARRLQDSPRFPQLKSAEYRKLLVRSVPLHDIGKIGVPEHILRKPGRLTVEECAIMQRHPRIGHDALLYAQRCLGVAGGCLHLAGEVALAHHERWDGTGYPDGLCGTQIPLAARLLALADVYDACRSRRAYRPPMPQRQVLELILQGRGTRFDPAVVDAFVEQQEAFAAVAECLADPQGLAL